MVCFASFRGDADGCAAACLRCETLALKALLPRAASCRHRRRSARCLVRLAGRGADLADHSRRLQQCRLQRRSVAAVTARQSGDAAALSPARADAAPCRGAAADQHICPTAHVRPDAHRRDTDLRQPQRLRRRRYRLQLAEHPAQQTEEAGAKAVPGAIVPQQPETTFTPVPTFNPAASPRPPLQVKPPLPVIYPLRAATRPGAILPPPADDLPVNNPPPEVHPVSAANRPGAALPVPAPEVYNYAVTNYLPDLSVSNPPPNLQPPNTFALGQLRSVCCRSWPRPILTPRSAFAPGSFLLLPSLDFRAACQHQSRTPARRSAGRLCCRRAGIDSALRLGAPLAVRRFRRFLDAIHPGSRAVAQCAVHEFQGRRPRRRDA